MECRRGSLRRLLVGRRGISFRVVVVELVLVVKKGRGGVVFVHCCARKKSIVQKLNNPKCHPKTPIYAQSFSVPFSVISINHFPSQIHRRIHHFISPHPHFHSLPRLPSSSHPSPSSSSYSSSHPHPTYSSHHHYPIPSHHFPDLVGHHLH